MAWSPPNKYVWDSWFAWRDAELHAFYLQADKLACGFDPEARHNLASVGHAVWSAHGWQECREALAPANNGGWDNLAIWTGSIIKGAGQTAHDQPYHLFYTSRSKEHEPIWTPSEWQRPQHIGVAVSDDLWHWQRTPATQRAPVIPNPGQRFGLDGVAWRDPYVLRLNEKQYAALICARLQPNGASFDAGDTGGVIAYVTSPDLQRWDATPQLIATPREFYQMEVPQIFWREFVDGVRCYLLFCAQERDCSPERKARGLACATGTYYLQSALLPHGLPRGETRIPAFLSSAQLLAAGLYGGKLLKPETDEAPVLLGFPWADAAGQFIGGISDPLRVRFDADGMIQVKNEK